MVARTCLLVCLATCLSGQLLAQAQGCTLKPPAVTLHFGKGSVLDFNTTSLTFYDRTLSSCPTDGHYSFTSFTDRCFRGDWHTLARDHTPGDAEGNMLLVNSAYSKGLFFTTGVKGLKGGAAYQFGAWLMNVCKPTKKCPFPLLPNLIIQLQTRSGKMVAQFLTGELPRMEVPRWTQHRAMFTMPSGETELTLLLINRSPGGCGNDFALDDITFRECVKEDPAKLVFAKKSPSIPARTPPTEMTMEAKQKNAAKAPARADTRLTTAIKTGKELTTAIVPGLPQKQVAFVPAPAVFKQRTTALAKQIETTAGELVLSLYDNGEIDGDTVPIYHNNVLVVQEQRLSKNPINFRLLVDKNQPHHEVVMVANNLGSIPPNTSLMIITARDKQYRVFISSSDQKNAKVVIDLKE